MDQTFISSTSVFLLSLSYFPEPWLTMLSSPCSSAGYVCVCVCVCALCVRCVCVVCACMYICVLFSFLNPHSFSSSLLFLHFPFVQVQTFDQFESVADGENLSNGIAACDIAHEMCAALASVSPLPTCVLHMHTGAHHLTHFPSSSHALALCVFPVVCSIPTFFSDELYSKVRRDVGDNDRHKVCKRVQAANLGEISAPLPLNHATPR